MLVRIILLVTLSFFTSVTQARGTIYAGGHLNRGCYGLGTNIWGGQMAVSGTCYSAVGGAQYEDIAGAWSFDATFVNYQPSNNTAKSASAINIGISRRINAGIARGQYSYNGIYTVMGVEKEGLLGNWNIPVGFGFRTVSNFLVEIVYVAAIPTMGDGVSPEGLSDGLRFSLYYALPSF